MDKISLISQVLGLAIGAGLNLYAAVLVTGISIHYGWLTNLPKELTALSHPAVLITAGILYALEFIADKVPFFTPLWDGLHTFIRPLGGALLALGATGDMDPQIKIFAMIAGGTISLGTHSSKMGLRLMAHSTPEPATHSAISILEDFGVVALIALAFQYPWIALPIMFLIVLAIAAFLPLLFRIARFLLAGLSGSCISWVSGGPGETAPSWIPDPPNAIRAYVRRAKGIPLLTSGWLSLSTGRFHYRRWGVKKYIELGPVETGQLQWGFVYNVVRTENGASFYLTKDWCTVFSPSVSGIRA